MSQPWIADRLLALLSRLDLVLPLLAAHLLADFTLQPRAWVVRKQARRLDPILAAHAAIAGILGYLLLARWGLWWLPLYLFLGHAVLDALKPRRDSSRVFLVDQALHGLHVLGALALLDWATAPAWPWLPGLGWLLAVTFLLNWEFAGVAIGKATSSWREDLGDEAGGLRRAGLWIGRLERVLIVAFVLAGHIEGVALLVTAKSIFRFSARNGEASRRVSEYFLVGTLGSLTVAMLTGLAAAALRTRL